MKRRAEHIATVLAFAPVIYLVEAILRALNGGPPSEDFGKFIWSLMWEPIVESERV